jgi:hypothetical protein
LVAGKNTHLRKLWPINSCQINHKGWKAYPGLTLFVVNMCSRQAFFAQYRAFNLCPDNCP